MGVWETADPPIAELAQFDAGAKAPAQKKGGPVFAMPCVQRKQEALRTLMNYRAAETLRSAANSFHVQDTKAEWRVDEWHKRYIAAASSYAFFCEQSMDENAQVTKTIRAKQGLEAQKAALSGLQEATRQHRERVTKATAKAREVKEKQDAHTHEVEQKELIKQMAEKARLERLRSYPQSSQDLLGFVAEAHTGKGLSGVKISSQCPFGTMSTEQQEEVTGQFSKYLIKNGIAGPEGYRCYVSYEKDGFIPLQFRVLIQRGDTQGIFRHAVLMPKLPKPPPIRIVLQYGSLPADIDAHLQVYADSHHDKWDIAAHRGEDTGFTYSQDGSATEFPFVTMPAKVNSGYGPQTHTIVQPVVGTYGYYVKNFDHHFTSNLKSHDSDARVFVYQGNKLTHRFAIRNAHGEPSKIWQVFSIKCTKPEKDISCAVAPIGSFVKEMPVSADIVAEVRA